MRVCVCVFETCHPLDQLKLDYLCFDSALFFVHDYKHGCFVQNMILAGL